MNAEDLTDAEKGAASAKIIEMTSPRAAPPPGSLLAATPRRAA